MSNFQRILCLQNSVQEVPISHPHHVQRVDDYTY